ncbi:MAG: hypothetical protein AB7O52_18975 [Planctomycetota bacterium]
MAVDKRPRDPDSPRDPLRRPPGGDSLDTENLGDFDAAALGTEDVGYSVRPRTPAEEALVQATLETEDVVVLLPTDDLDAAADLPEIEEVRSQEPRVSRPDLQVRGAGLRSQLGESSQTESMPTDAVDTDDFEAVENAVGVGSAEPDDSGWAWSKSEALPELEDVEDITAMLPAEGDSYQLVSPSDALDPELAALGLGGEGASATHRSWLPMLAVAAMLVGAVYFGLDIYRDQLGNSRNPREVAHATDPASGDPTDPDPTLPADPVDPSPGGPQPGPDRLGTGTAGDPTPADPEGSTPTEGAPPTNDPGATPTAAVVEFRQWVGRSLSHHLNPTLDRDN